MEALNLLLVFGIPTTITGIAAWWLKRKIEYNDKKRQEHESNLEALVLMMMQSTRANSVGITAIARAVQRIPAQRCAGCCCISGSARPTQPDAR